MSPIIKEFLTTDIGLASLAVIGTTVVIVCYIAYVIMAKSREE